MRITRFEEIEAWKEARQLTSLVYGMTREVLFAKDFGLSSQVQRASVSVMSNIAEGFDSGSNLEFVRFLRYARRSASEVQSILYAALDQCYIPQQIFASTYKQAEKVRRMATSFMSYLRAHQGNSTSPVLRTRQRVNASTR